MAKYTHIRTEFVENKAESPNGPHYQKRFVMQAGPACEKMEEAFGNMAESAGGYRRINKCDICGNEFDGTLGNSILYHLEKAHQLGK